MQSGAWQSERHAVSHRSRKVVSVVVNGLFQPHRPAPPTAESMLLLTYVAPSLADAPEELTAAATATAEVPAHDSSYQPPLFKAMEEKDVLQVGATINTQAVPISSYSPTSPVSTLEQMDNRPEESTLRDMGEPMAKIPPRPGESAGVCNLVDALFAEAEHQVRSFAAAEVLDGVPVNYKERHVVQDAAEEDNL